ncbi:MAG TPA: hypothetical protein VFE16_12475 [Candidatus Cybelea sp.]|nr:hypothetical protein [Candidatus Cybelea sp.]
MTILTLISILLAAAPANAPSPQPGRAAPTASPALSPDALFSRRALRRARLLIQMRMFQLRDERLECVREALLRRLPDALWPELPSPTRGNPSGASAVAHCGQILRF